MSKRAHLTEAIANTVSGFIISFFLMHLLSILFGYNATWSKSFWIVMIFTSVSVARNYFWRRFFYNKYWQRLST